MGTDRESIGRRDALRRVAGAGAVGAAAWAAPAVSGISVVPRLAQAQSGGGGGPGEPCPGDGLVSEFRAVPWECEAMCSVSGENGESPTYGGTAFVPPDGNEFATGYVNGGMPTDRPEGGQPTNVAGFVAGVVLGSTAGSCGELLSLWSDEEGGTWSETVTYRPPQGLTTISSPGLVEFTGALPPPPYTTPAGVSATSSGALGNTVTLSNAPASLTVPPPWLFPGGTERPGLWWGGTAAAVVSYDSPSAYSLSMTFVAPVGTMYANEEIDQAWTVSVSLTCDALPAEEVFSVPSCTST